MSDQKLLVGDIGGTNARFALANSESPGYSAERILRCADFDTSIDAIRSYLDWAGVDTPHAVCLAAAGPVVDDSIDLTNNSWRLSVAELAASLSTDRVRLLNDFAAIAYSVPFLAAGELMQVNGPTPRSLAEGDYSIGVIGPGTGLGCVGLRKVDGRLVLINSEGSHAGFAPETRRQIEILSFLREQRDRVSSECLVSGVGMQNLYGALAHLHGAADRELSVADVFARADAGTDPVAIEAVATFFEILGQVAGDLALTLYAADGIFIAGGIAQRYPQRLVSSRFRAGFDRKGTHAFLVERIPTQLILHPQPGLLGAAYCALELASH